MSNLLQFKPQTYSAVQIPKTSQNYMSTVPQSVSYQHQQAYYNTPLSASINLQPQYQQPIQYQQLPIQYAQPKQYEVHHVERPLEVISIDEIENPWRLKCATLERQILELQIQLRKGMPQDTVEVIDDSKVKALEKRIADLKNISNERDNEIDDLQQRINDLNAQIEETSTTQITFLTTEVETWKRKFKELESDLEQTESELAKADAELTRLKRQDQQNSSQVGTRTEVRKVTKN